MGTSFRIAVVTKLLSRNDSVGFGSACVSHALVGVSPTRPSAREAHCLVRGHPPKTIGETPMAATETVALPSLTESFRLGETSCRFSRPVSFNHNFEGGSLRHCPCERDVVRCQATSEIASGTQFGIDGAERDVNSIRTKHTTCLRLARSIREWHKQNSWRVPRKRF